MPHRAAIHLPQTIAFAAVIAISLIVSSALTDQAGTTAATQPAPVARVNGPSQIFLPFVASGAHFGRDSWLQFGFDSQHSGNDSQESFISVKNVGSLRQLFRQRLPFVTDGSPAYLSNVTTPLGVRDLIFLTSTAGDIAAVDADTAAVIWANQSYGAGGCSINNVGGAPCYTTSSPAIDPNRQFVYSYGLDGAVHKFAVGDGTETLTSGWPETTTLKGYDEKGSSALSVATARSGVSYLYVSHAGYPGDAGDYQGHVTTVNLNDGSQKVYNSLCSNQAVHFADSRLGQKPDCPEVQSGVWSRPGVVYDPASDRIYVSTGNGTFNPNAFDWGDTVLALNPDGTGAGGAPLDSYTPSDYQSLQNADLDIGSTAVAILPPSAGKYRHLAVQGGKDGILRLINLDNLSGQGHAGHSGGEVLWIPVPMGGEILTQPAVWTNPSDGSSWIFVANDSGIAGLQLSIDGSGNPSLRPSWTQPGGTSPIVANGVLFYARSGLITALNPTDGTPLWSDNRIGSIHWASPIVANGVLYLADQQGYLTAYGL